MFNKKLKCFIADDDGRINWIYNLSDLDNLKSLFKLSSFILQLQQTNSSQYYFINFVEIR